MNTKAICGSFQLVRWLPPPLGWTKVNTDGACKANPGMAATGGVMRDNHSKFIAAYASFLGPQTSVIAEAKAILMGTCFAKSLNITHLWIETVHSFWLICLMILLMFL